jgi:hypothetical protein
MNLRLKLTLLFLAGNGFLLHSQQSINIVKRYYASLHFAHNNNGKFLRQSWKEISVRLENDFQLDTDIVVISNCSYMFGHNLTGCIYSLRRNQYYFFNRYGDNKPVILNEPASITDSLFFNKIRNLLIKDSLSVYEEQNKHAKPADDEFDLLKVARFTKTNKIYKQEQFVFWNPLSLRIELFGR